MFNKELERRNTRGERGWVVRGINVDDRQLNGDVFEARPRLYGNATISENEAEVLKLSPKFAIFDHVDVVLAEAEAEKAMCKLRWNRMNDDTKDGNLDTSNHGGNDLSSDSINNNIGRTIQDSHVDLVQVDSGVVVRPPGPGTGSNPNPTPPNPSPNPIPGPDHNPSPNLPTRPAQDLSSIAAPALTLTSGSDEGQSQSNRPRLPEYGYVRDSRRWHYDPETSTIDLRNLRATDLPFNRFVYIPDPLPEEEEIKIQNLKNDLKNAASDYVRECEAKRKKGRKKKVFQNLTERESEGLNKLQKREEVVVFQTDKSGRFAVDTRDSYVEATMPHIVGDAIVEEAVHQRAQKEANAHSVMWTRIMKAGENASTKAASGMQRVKDNMQVQNHGYAPLYSLRKDHKEVENITQGPPTRPVCGGSAAYNSKISHYLGLILRPVWQETETVCQSTEEMLAAINDLNDSGQLDHMCTIGSEDVRALYPSIDIDFTCEKVAETFMSSNVNVDEDSVNKRELGLYLALNRTPTQLLALGIQRYCPTRKNRRGRPPNITGSAPKPEKERFKPWNKPEEEPDGAATKKMIAVALSVGVNFTMKNHLYSFNGEMRRQEKGGPIGLALTGDVAQILMAWWDKQLIARLEARGMKMLLYKRYVDDIVLVVRNMVRDDSGKPRDESNMCMVQEVANTIHPSIEVTFDCPSKHEDIKMPVLDLKVWSTHDRNQETREPFVRIMHEHYHKEVASKAVVHARSALPWKTKRTIHTQEVIRILRNCSKYLPSNVTRSHVEEYVARMQYSGYDKEFRAQVVESALKGFDCMLERDASGEEPLYRPREWNRVERAKAWRAKKTDWFKGGKTGNESVVFVPATPGSEMKRRYLSVIAKAGMRIGVVEVPGMNLKRRLQRSDPFRKEKCGEGDCLVCAEGDGGRCRAEGVTYRITCKGCGETYVGETSQNAYTRGLAHMRTVTANLPPPKAGEKEKPKPTLRHHVDEMHGNDTGIPSFKMEVLKVFGGDALLRQVSEAVLIRETKGQMNRQEEWRRIQLPHLGLLE